jgi:DNA modification methylase
MRLSDVEAAFQRRNPRRHDVKTIAAIIRETGFNAPPLLNEKTVRLVYGHGRTKAVRWLFENKPEQVPDRIELDEDGEWMLPVLRGVSMSKTRAEEYLIADNRAAEKSRWEREGHAEILDRIRKRGRLAATGYTSGQVEKLLAKVRKNAPETDVKIPETPKEAGVERGEIWRLGKHRIMCGDSMDEADVDQLLGGEVVDMGLMDPPFAIYGSSTGIGADIADDKMVRPFFKALGRQLHRVLREFAHAYVCCDWRSYAALWEGLSGARLSPKNCLIWDKGDGGLGGSYMQCHEFVTFWAKLPPARAMQSNDRRGQRTVNDSNILRHNRPTGDERQHNAAKPVPMLQRVIRNSSEPGERILDLFSGSGSVLMACEREGRVCLAMDMEPMEVRKTIARWELLTGKQATRVDTERVA